MNRSVNVELIQHWIDMNAPAGLEKLVLKSGVSGQLILKIKNKINPLVPKKVATLVKIANALETDIDTVFPLINSENSAS